MMEKIENFRLSNGVDIPSVGFGTYLLPENKLAAILDTAFAEGYRHFDTAAAYQNEHLIGEWITNSGISRRELFITGKLRNSLRGYETTYQGFEESLTKLNLSYFDLYLIHWPASSHQFSNWKDINAETWKAMAELYKSGKVKAIGVSNFLPHHLDILMSHDIKPTVNQIEYHPGHLQEETIAFCRKNHILVEAWSPLGRGSMLNNDVLTSIAANHQRSVAQICIRWCLQHGVLPLPKSSENERIKQNIDVFDFHLSEEEMEQIDALPDFGSSGLHPDKVDF